MLWLWILNLKGSQWPESGCQQFLDVNSKKLLRRWYFLKEVLRLDNTLSSGVWDIRVILEYIWGFVVLKKCFIPKHRPVDDDGTSRHTVSNSVFDLGCDVATSAHSTCSRIWYKGESWWLSVGVHFHFHPGHILLYFPSWTLTPTRSLYTFYYWYFHSS